MLTKEQLDQLKGLSPKTSTGNLNASGIGAEDYLNQVISKRGGANLKTTNTGGFFGSNASSEDPYQTGKIESSPVLPYAGKQEGIISGGLKTVVNAPTSAIRFIESAINPMTYIGLGKDIAGGIQSIPGIKEWYDKHSSGNGAEILAGNREAANQFATQVANQYGSLENIKRSVVEDPVGTALLLRGLLEGGAKLTSESSSLAKTAGMTKTAGALETTSNVIKNTGKVIAPVERVASMVSNIPSFLSKLKEGPTITPEQITGKITMAKPQDVKGVGQALSQLPKEQLTQKGTTFKDVSEGLQKSVDLNETKTGKIYEGDRNTFSKKDYTLTEKTASGKKISTNYMDLALEKFKELYNKTNESPANKVELQDAIDHFNKNKTTAENIELMAKKFGTEFKEKAFGKNGEQLTSVTAREFENIRKGLKETARKLVNNKEVDMIDKQTSRFLKAKDYVDKMDKKLQDYVNTHEKPGIMKKIGNLTGKVLNVKGFLKGLLNPNGMDMTKLNPIELEKRLPSLLKQLDNISKMSPEDIINKYGK